MACKNSKTTTDGNTLKFYSSVRLDIRKVSTIKGKENITGNETRVKVIKKQGISLFREAKFDIIHNKGIPKLGEIIDIGAKLRVSLKKLTLIITITTHTLKRTENIKNHFKSNKEVTNEVKAKIRDLPENSGDFIINRDEKKLVSLEEEIF